MRHSGSCPGCEQYIYRMRGDSLLRCHRCGWTEGWPVLRWVTHYPRRLWRRTQRKRGRVVGELLTTAKWVLILGFVWTMTLGPGGAFALGQIDGFSGDWAADGNTDDRSGDSVGDDPAGGADGREAVTRTSTHMPERTPAVDSDGDNLPNSFEQKHDNANTWQKDIYVTVVYGSNVDPLTERQVASLERRFGNMPVSNPNGQTGIRFHLLDQEPAGEEIHWSEDTYGALRDEYYTTDRLGGWHCRAHMVVIGEETDPIAWGRGASPGHFVVTNGTYDVTYRNGASSETLTTIHELLHNIVGQFPSSYDNVSSASHTRTGYLSYAESYEESSFMSDPTATLLSDRGFSKPPSNTIGGC